MKMIGFLLLTVGFLAGSLVAVQTPDNHVNWAQFVPAAIIAVVGIVLSRHSDRRKAVAAAAEGSGLRIVRRSIDRIVENIRTFDASKGELNPYDAHGRIDELFVVDLNLFADHRKQIANLHGLQGYAEVMNEFAAGERYLNRVWSASVDGYIDEVNEYIGKAREQFERTQATLERLSAAA
jgi:hypothetical protein